MHLADQRCTKLAQATPSNSGYSGYSGYSGSREGESDEGRWGPITHLTVESAIALAQYLLDHVQAAFALMGVDPDVEHARRILAWIERTRAQRFSKRDVWQTTRAYFKKASELDAPLSLLCEHGYLREQYQERSGPGRKPSSVFLVNPHSQGSELGREEGQCR